MPARKSIPHELLVVDIMKTADIITAQVKSIFKEHGITPVQYNMLRILRGARPEVLGVGEVRERLTFASGDTSRLLDRLVSKGLVDRAICPSNRRKMNVSIAPNGLKLLDTIGDLMHVKLNGFYEDRLSLESVEMMREKLNTIRTTVQ